MTLCLPDHYMIEVSFWTSLQFLAAKMSHFCIFSLKVFCVAVTSTNIKTTLFFKLFYIYFAIEFLHIVAHICSSHALFTRLYYDCTHSEYTVLNFITALKAHLYLQKFILQAQPVSYLVTSPKFYHVIENVIMYVYYYSTYYFRLYLFSTVMFCSSILHFLLSHL